MEINLFADDPDEVSAKDNDINNNSFELEDFTNLEQTSPKLQSEFQHLELEDEKCYSSGIDDVKVPDIDVALKQLGTAESDDENNIPFSKKDHQSDDGDGLNENYEEKDEHAIMGITFNDEEEEVYEPVEDAVEKVGRWTYSAGAARKATKALTLADESDGSAKRSIKNNEAEKMAIHSESQRLIRGQMLRY